MEELRFACDAMLGTLARWLRFAGFDAFYEAGISDAHLAGLARGEGRWLLTSDRRLAASAGPRSLLVRAGTVEAQVGEVRRRLPLVVDANRFFTRCPVCNAALDEISREEAQTCVPPYVARTAPRFRRCLGCRRTYWPGTHAARIADRLARIFTAG